MIIDLAISLVLTTFGECMVHFGTDHAETNKKTSSILECNKLCNILGLLQASIYKNKLVVLTTEWLPWLQSSLEPRLSVPDFVSQLWRKIKIRNGKPGFEASCNQAEETMVRSLIA